MGKQSVDFTTSFDIPVKKKQESIRLVKQQLESAYSRIAELETLVEKQEAREIPLNQIEANRDQPRKSFYVIKEMKNLLLMQGQKQPIELVQIPGKNKYTIFDGECRYRAASQLNWTSIKAVFVPYNSETFQTDVLISSLNKSSITALDEAEAIVREIQKEINLSNTEICNKLAAFVTYTRRTGSLEELKRLTTDYPEQAVIIDKLQFRDEAEKVICLVIANLGRFCLSTSSNKFPLLKLSQDIKEAIREQGLNETVALRLQTINSESKKLKGKITETRASKIRQELIAKIISNEWSVKTSCEAIKNRIQEIMGKDNQSSTVQSYAKYLDRMKIANLTSSDKDLLLERLRNLMARIESHSHIS